MTTADTAVTCRCTPPTDASRTLDNPPELRDRPSRELAFPLFHFERADLFQPGREASRLHEATSPDLQLVYLPHLDYALQQLGPEDPSIARHVREIDELAGDLIDFYRDRGCRVLAVSEYGIGPVDDAVAINRILREAGLLAIREERGRELLDAGASKAFAIADHQIAHVYLGDDVDPATVRPLLEASDGIDEVLAGDELHPDAHSVAAIWSAREPRRLPGIWLMRNGPDFARTVDIHAPGYDPRNSSIHRPVRGNHGDAPQRLGWT